MEVFGILIVVLLVIVAILLWMANDSAVDETPYGGTEVEDKKGEGP